MATIHIQSAWLRFVRKFGVAFFWACVFSLLFGAAAYFRVERRDLEGELRWHAAARLLLERVEWATFDWRARQLGADSERRDDVIIVAVDEETSANARVSEHPEWATSPWPRDLLGKVAEQAVREGAALVAIDESLSEVSPHHCPPCRATEPAGKSDDELLGVRLDRLSGRVVTAFDWAPESRRPPDRPLTPFLLNVGEFPDASSARELVRAALTRRATTYLVPSEGGRVVLWAGATTDAKARSLHAELGLEGPAAVRPLTPADDEREVSRDWLLVEAAGVHPVGLALEALPQARTLDGPVAPALSPNAPPGAVTMTPDADGMVRAVPLLVAAGGAAALPSMALQGILALSGGKSVEVSDGALVAGGRHQVPIDAQGFLTLRWDAEEAGRGGQGTMRRALPVWRLLMNLTDDEAGRGIRHYDNDLQGRIVVLTDLRREDRDVSTPVGTLSRAAVLAQAMANLLHGQAIARVRPEVDLWLTVAFALTGAVLAVAWSSLVKRPGWLAWVLTIALGCALHALVARQLFVGQLRWVGMAAPLGAYAFTFLASLGYARTLEQGLRDFVFRALGGAVRADVFRRVEKDLALMRPERRELAVYFSDIEGFTAVAHHQPPRTVVSVLQDYLGEMTTLILDGEGHVDKYLGDGLMAFWGAPVELPEAAAVACSAALAMQARFDERRAEWEKLVGQSLVLRAGLEAGPTLVGEMGTMHRVNYTVMGEPVATAARLESLAKHYGARILVGPSVTQAAGDRFVFRDVDLVRLGRAAEPIRVSELLGRSDELQDEAPALARYAEALGLYRSRRFAEASVAFDALAAERPHDALVRRYADRCRAYLETPPPEGWDGVYDGPVRG